MQCSSFKDFDSPHIFLYSYKNELMHSFAGKDRLSHCQIKSPHIGYQIAHCGHTENNEKEKECFVFFACILSEHLSIML